MPRDAILSDRCTSDFGCFSSLTGLGAKVGLMVRTVSCTFDYIILELIP